MSHNRLIYGNCLEILPQICCGTCLFADPPDNIGKNYGSYNDNQDTTKYIHWLKECLNLFIKKASIIWLSYNAKWLNHVGAIVRDLEDEYCRLEIKPCMQTFTFGQHNQRDLGNNYRPLLRFQCNNAPLYPDAIRVPSWRQQYGDKRADPRGRVPGDVFDFPRVTGNSKQRRKWCPTQLHEGLVERCIKLSTREGERVIDPFAGTGTTLRVCKRINRPCTLIERNYNYCQKIAEEHNLRIENSPREETGGPKSPGPGGRKDLPGQTYFGW